MFKEMKNYFIYILTNNYNKVLYIGVTNNLLKRVWEHRNCEDKKHFTKKYHIYKLVYYEEYPSIADAIGREKQLKGGSRQKKINLINNFNCEWRDLYEEMI